MMTKETNIVKWGMGSIVWVQSENIQAALDVLKDRKADGLGISPYSGYESEDISFLNDLPDLRGLVLPYAHKYNLRQLEKLSKLRFITVAGNTQAVDYGSFKELEELRIDWHPKIRLPDAVSKIRSMRIDKFRNKSKSLKSFPAYEGLRDIEFVQGNIASLEGIEHLKELCSVSLFNLRNLHSVGALVETNVAHLHIEGCKKIGDIETLSSCRKLTRLRLIDSGKLQSLRFLDRFEKLEEFRFVNTVIEDGDMTPLLRMKSVGFLKRRGYSHTPEEIRELLESSSN